MHAILCQELTTNTRWISNPLLAYFWAIVQITKGRSVLILKKRTYIARNMSFNKKIFPFENTTDKTMKAKATENSTGLTLTNPPYTFTRFGCRYLQIMLQS